MTSRPIYTFTPFATDSVAHGARRDRDARRHRAAVALAVRSDLRVDGQSSSDACTRGSLRAMLRTAVTAPWVWAFLWVLIELSMAYSASTSTLLLVTYFATTARRECRGGAHAECSARPADWPGAGGGRRRHGGLRREHVLRQRYPHRRVPRHERVPARHRVLVSTAGDSDDGGRVGDRSNSVGNPTLRAVGLSNRRPCPARNPILCALCSLISPPTRTSPLRSLRRRPTFAVVAIATIALAIGAATSIYSVVDGVLFRSLPYHDSGKIVAVWQTDTIRKKQALLSASTGTACRSTTPTSSSGARSRRRSRRRRVGGMRRDARRGERRRSRSPVRASARALFEVLGVRPVLGRTFLPGEDVIGGPARDDGELRGVDVALRLASERRRFDGRSSTTSRTRSSACSRRASRSCADDPAGRSAIPAGQSKGDIGMHNRSFHAIARLKPGVSRSSARTSRPNSCSNTSTPDAPQGRAHRRLPARRNARRARAAAHAARRRRTPAAHRVCQHCHAAARRSGDARRRDECARRARRESRAHRSSVAHGKRAARRRRFGAWRAARVVGHEGDRRARARSDSRNSTPRTSTDACCSRRSSARR